MATQQQQEKQKQEKDQQDLPPGWTVRLDHKFESKPRKYVPGFWTTLKLLPVAFRLTMACRGVRQQGREPPIDVWNEPLGQQIRGVPLGGIGAGTIGRGWQGDFNRWQTHPGSYTHAQVAADQFILTVRDPADNNAVLLHRVLHPGRIGHHLSAWEWLDSTRSSHATYRALYPQAWTEYNFPDLSLKVVCHQVSPVIPHDYVRSSFPVAAFNWTVENKSSRPLQVTITFSFQNGCGEEADAAGGHSNESFVFDDMLLGTVKGVALHHKLEMNPYVLSIASHTYGGSSDPNISVLGRYATTGDGEALWSSLRETGELPDSDDPSPSNPKETIGAAVAASLTVQPQQTSEATFSLAWDQPRVTFLGREQVFTRRYTLFMPADCNPAEDLSRITLSGWREWVRDINTWQAPVLSDPQLPAWFKSALFNELYVLIDSGTVWLRQDDQEPGSPPPVPLKYLSKHGMFAYLEGHEYRLFNTLDVHFYASFALAQLWPELQMALIENFALTIDKQDDEAYLDIMDKLPSRRKAPGSLPHDIGCPGDEPFTKLNAYTLHDTSHWKDLNVKFILQVYRDYVLSDDRDFLHRMWPYCRRAMELPISQDTDNDGLIDNDGTADQTYDAWPVKGASAYCGGLFLAALQVMCTVAAMEEDTAAAARYSELLKRGTETYMTKLWNGKFFNYDSDKNGAETIQADQLAGHGYLRLCGLPSYLTSEVAKTALHTIFENNVMRFCDGNMGAVNGVHASTGTVDTTNMMSQEVWTGVTYLLASTMMEEDMLDEGFQTAKGIYESVYNRLGLGFQTPEALVGSGAYRALAYMRPLAIWAMHMAWKRRSARPEEPAAAADEEGGAEKETKEEEQ